MPETSPYLDRPTRSLEDYLAEMEAEYEAMPQTAYLARGRLADRILAVEMELAWRVEL